MTTIETVAPMPPEAATDAPPSKVFQPGTLLEAAFVDPAYSFPPADGEGKNAIELQSMIADEDDASFHTTESARAAMQLPEKPPRTTTLVHKKKWWQCCGKSAVVEVVDMKEYEAQTKRAMSARRLHQQMKKDAAQQRRMRDKYNRVPEGILIYQLDTATHTLKLLSPPHPNTNLKTLVREMQIVSAEPSNSKTRRGMHLRGSRGEECTLVACEQRIAIAWLEAMDMMLANKKDFSRVDSSRNWGKENLTSDERLAIEGEYLNLADYSNKLLRAGASAKAKSEAGGIYYSIDVQREDGNDDADEEAALEVIAKRRAVIKDSWDFYRLICSLLRDRRKYDEVFRKMQLDPVYPYLNSMTGLNDPGDSGYENTDKAVMQKDLPEFGNMTKTQVAEALVRQAEAATSSLVEICKALAGSLGMEEVGVGPVKEVSAALRKAEKKYDGDLLKITDYCRALLVVKDFPSLLALLELARDSFGPLIRRVKLSTLKSDQNPKAGGYRDCIINLELKNHVCEIQVHLWPMWVVCGVDGFRHYRHCLEYSTDTFGDPFDALDGLDRKTVAELTVMAEEAVAAIPLNSLEWYQEKYILDYFAEVGLFLRHGLDVWAEVTLRHLIKLRNESPDIGPDHSETLILYRSLERALLAQGKNEEAREVASKVKASEKRIKEEKKAEEKSFLESLFNSPAEAYDMLVDPNKKEREEEQKMRKEVKASKKHWRRIRQERFQFLDASVRQSDEKKVEDAMD